MMSKAFSKALAYFVIVTMLSMMFVFMTPETAMAASVYYVDAVNGNDSTGNGSSGSPWKTIGKAAGIMTAGDTCRIRTGVYRETVIPANSGASGAPITFMADTGADVTVSGADPVTNTWSVHSGNIYKASATLSMGNWLNQVFVDGVAMNLARWPNSGTNPMSISFKEADTGTNDTKIVDAELTKPNGYYNGAGVVAMDQYRWAIANGTVSSYTTGQLNISLGYSFGLGVLGGYGSAYYIVGNFADLDSANEWYYNSTTATLYLQTPNGDNPAGHTVEYKARNNAFNLNGKSRINIKGIKLFASTIDASSANNCIIDGINGKYLSHYDLDMSSSLLWSSGILLGGSNNELKNSVLAYSPGNLVTETGNNNRVVNNEMHDCAYGPYYGCEAANIYTNGTGVLISHNTLYNTGRSVISGKPVNARIQYNNCYNAMRYMDDGAFIYIATTDGKGTEIHHNIFDNGYYNPPYQISGGIYLDYGTFDFKVYNNVTSNIRSFGLFFHAYQLFTHAFNNTFYNKSYIKMKDDWGATDAYGVRLINNISYEGLLTAPPFEVVETNNFKSGDPLFVNPGSKDFRLQSSSSAINAGRVISGITDGYSGSAPDIGAYEYGVTAWTAGHNFSSPPNPSFTTHDIRYENFLQDSYFEVDANPMGAWTRTGAQTAAVVTDTGDKLSARERWMNGLRLGSAADGVEQIVSGLSQNTEYELRGYARTADSVQSVSIGVRYGSANTSQQITSTSWTRKTIRFNTGSSTSATVYVNKTTAGGLAYADDITLVEVEVPSPTPTPTPTPSTTPTPTPVPGTNLALNKTVSASSIYDANYPASYAVDGNGTTRWSSAASDPQWIYVDLGAAMNINRVVLKWDPAYGTSYKVQVSNDANNWTDVYTTTTGDGGIDDISFTTTNARYVRMYGTQRATFYGYSLWEFEVYAPENLALNKTVSASSIYDANYPASYAVDGNGTTRWSSAASDPQWFYVDLGTSRNISRVKLNWDPAYGISYKIQVSNNASNWTDVYSTTSGDGGIDDISFTTVNARYVRMYGTQRATFYGYSFWEFEVY